MAYSETAQVLLPSILDRLIDDNPESDRDPIDDPLDALHKIQNSIARDLEQLLNTRLYWPETPPYLSELKHSLLNYGIPDFSTVSLGSEEHKEVFVAMILDAIKHFEPRFRKVDIEILENHDKEDRTLRFRTQAWLEIEPNPLAVVFDSQIDAIERALRVKVSNHG